MSSFFKDHWLGIFVSSVVAGLLSTYIYNHFPTGISLSTREEAPRSEDSPDSKLSPEIKAAVDSYAFAYEQVELRRLSLEQFYQQVQDLRDTLLSHPDNQPTVLETLSPSAFNEVQQRLIGLVMNRDEAGIIFVDIDPLFFITTARQYGTEADAQFFEIYRETYPRYYIWPAWAQQQTDYTYCTKYEAHNLVDLWNAWTLYHAHFPGYYTDKVTDIIESIESELTSGTCACGDRDSVALELRSFLNKFPNDQIADTVRERLAGIEERHTEIRFHCLSG